MFRYDPIVQRINCNLFFEKNIAVDVLRLDLIHPDVSGNKWFKLKYNLAEAEKLGLKTILTFGGAFSNHIIATAEAARLSGFNSIGVIRGEESSMSNSTLCESEKAGMQFHFVSREKYKLKEEISFINELKDKFGDFYLIPEGGNNELGISGCAEILTDEMNHQYVFCATGTGATYKGLLKKIKVNQKLTGINVLKGDGFDKNFISDYHFGGYAKHNPQLIDFKNSFESEFEIPLDYVYTAKLFYAVFDLIRKNSIAENSNVMIVHSGGLQGNKGYEKRYNLNPSR